MAEPTFVKVEDVSAANENVYKVTLSDVDAKLIGDVANALANDPNSYGPDKEATIPSLIAMSIASFINYSEQRLMQTNKIYKRPKFSIIDGDKKEEK